MAEEVELKLTLPESAQRRFLRQPVLATATGKTTRQLVSIYYDTPDLTLRKSGVAVRLRRQGRAWLQTVKCAGVSAGGLSARPEWEVPYGGHFDFSGIDDPRVRRRLEKRSVLARLTPLFETSFRRTTWSFDGLLLMFDRGWIAAGGHREAISELELELAGDDIGKLFALAERLAESLPLMPALLSKADRGTRLYQGIAMMPWRAGEIALAPDMTPAKAFRTIAFSCLEHMQHNLAGAIDSDDAEYIHQMRVGMRRLRACLRLFAPQLPAGFVDAVMPVLHATMRLLGAARDLDVLLAEITAPVMAALPDEPRLAALVGVVTDRRFAARRAAIRALVAHDFSRWLLRVIALLHTAELPAGHDITAAEFAAGQLDRLSRKLRRRARHATPDDPAVLHTLRIDIKRLRYALEFFAPLGEAKARQRLANRLTEGQTALGALNDLANAGRLLMDCAGSDDRLREAVSLIGGWHGPRHAQLMGRLPAMLTELRRRR